MTVPFDIPPQLAGMPLLPVAIVAEAGGSVRKPPATKRKWSVPEYEPTDEEWAGADAYGVRLRDLLVVDVDARPPEAIRNLLDRYETLVVRTPRGFHFYFAGANSQTFPAPTWGDIKRGPNQYVVGPGSPGYSVINDAPLLRSYATEPLRKLMLNQRAVADNPYTTPVGRGNRNDKLTSLAGFMQSQGWSEASTNAALHAANAALTAPLPDSELEATVDRVHGRYS